MVYFRAKIKKGLNHAGAKSGSTPPLNGVINSAPAGGTSQQLSTSGADVKSADNGTTTAPITMGSELKAQVSQPYMHKHLKNAHNKYNDVFLFADNENIWLSQ